MFINLRNVNYYYSNYSSSSFAPYLFMLHGFMGSSESFSDLIPQLRTFCNPITIDLIGHGLTDAPDDFQRYKAEEQIEDLRDFITKLSSNNVVLLGYSMGGRLALQFAAKYPDLLTGLILESTTYGIDQSNEIQKRLQIDQQRADEIIQNYRDFTEQWNKGPLFKRYSSLPLSKKQRLEQIQNSQKPHGLANSLLGFGTAAMPSVHDKLDELSLETLILTGEDDEKFTTIGKEMNRLIKNSSQEIIPKCGHRIHLEKPDLYLKYIKSFIISRNK